MGNFSEITKLNSIGYNLNECIDVSLKAYLSSLYLKNDTCEINFKSDKNISPIVPQTVLEKVDKMVRMGAVL